MHSNSRFQHRVTFSVQANGLLLRSPCSGTQFGARSLESCSVKDLFLSLTVLHFICLNFKLPEFAESNYMWIEFFTWFISDYVCRQYWLVASLGNQNSWDSIRKELLFQLSLLFTWRRCSLVYWWLQLWLYMRTAKLNWKKQIPFSRLACDNFSHIFLILMLLR